MSILKKGDFIPLIAKSDVFIKRVPKEFQLKYASLLVVRVIEGIENAFFTEESLKDTNMVKTLVICYILSVLVAFALMPMTIHQMGTYSTLAGEVGFANQTGEAYSYFENFVSTYGDRFRTFKHGAFHGMLYGVFLVMPILGIIAMFEKKSFKYVAINASYWIVTLGIMGGIVCKYAM